MAVNVKMGVDLGDFKSKVTEARNEIKTLNANMELVEATFKNTGDAEQAMAQKLGTLNSKLEAQKKLVQEYETALKKMTSAGVDPASASYQKMAQDMLKAQTDMQKTQTEINSLGTSAQEAAGKTDELAASVNGIGKKMSLEQVIGGIDKITDGMEKAAKKAVKLGKAIVSEVLGAGNWADELKTTAEAYGISTDELQRMEKTAQIIDTDVDAILQARGRLGKNAGKVEELLGFSVDGMTIEDAFWKTGEAIMAMGDAMKQEEAAQKVFGRSWRELVPLFNAGREEYERVSSTWNTISDDQLSSLQEMDDKYQTLKADIETLKMEALSQLAEPMANLMQSLSDLIASDEGQAAIDTVMGTIKDTLNWISENSGTVVAAIGAIGTAFAGLKVSETVLTFVKLVNGMKGLFGGGAAGAATGAGGGGWLSGVAAKIGASAGGASALTPLAVFGAGILPALWAGENDKQRWSANYNRRMSAANLPDNNAWFISQAADALGLNGQVNFGTAESLLMGLSSRSNMQKAELYNLLSGSTTAGNSTWNLLNSYWNGAELDQGVVDELLQNITDAFANNAEKAQVPVDVEVPEDAAAQISEQVGVVTVRGQVELGPEGGFANGLPYVPYDGYLASLHRGERVVPAREASRSFNSNLYVENMVMNNGTDAAGLAASIAAAQRRTMSGYGS